MVCSSGLKTILGRAGKRRSSSWLRFHGVDRGAKGAGSRRRRGGRRAPLPAPNVGAQAPWDTVKPAARGPWDQQRWRRPRRRERPGRQPQPELQPGPRGCFTGAVGGGPEPGPGSGWPPPPPRRGTGTGRGAVAGVRVAGEDSPGPGRTPPTRAGARRAPQAWENRAGGTASVGRGEHSAGLRSQSAGSAFLPSRGADPPKPCCGGSSAEIKGRGLARPPSPPLSPRPTPRCSSGVGEGLIPQTPVQVASFTAGRARG